jgi:SAM-dependent methyltransferase
VLARVMAPTTEDLFDIVGIPADASCLDVGCGGGDVTLTLARRAHAGRTAGVDLDEEKIALARAEAAAAGVTNVEFGTGDVMAPADGARHDVVYVRFLLTHLPDPAAALARIVDRLAPGGVLLVEDIDFRGHVCHPPNEAFDRYVELYCAAVHGRGCDPNIGPRLPGLLVDAGLEDVGVRVVQPAGIEGEVKLISPITLEAIADAVLAAGLETEERLHRTVDDLYAFAATPGTFLALPRIVQAWGRAPASGTDPVAARP